MKKMGASLKTILSLLFGAIVLIIALESYAEQKGTPKYGGTLRIGVEYDITTLHPFRDTRGVDTYVRSLVFEGLTALDEKMINLVPGLARSWDISRDGKTYTFHLRKGVRFHNGKEMDSEDVKWSIDYISDPKNQAYSRGYYAEVESVSIMDKYTIRIALKKPYSPLLDALLSAKNLVIVPKDTVFSPDSFPPGTGPFKLVEWRSGDHITLESYKDYWQKGLPYLDRVIIKPITDENVRLTALRAGDIDICMAIPQGMVSRARKIGIKDILLLPPYGADSKRLRFNVRKPPFNDVRVRQAIAFALDKKEILAATAWGEGEVSNQKYPKGHLWYLAVPDRLKDLKKAKELLTEAGYPKGLKISIPVHRDSLDVALLIKDQLAKIKVMVDIEIMERSAYRARIRKREFDVVISGGGLVVDPDGAYFRDFYSKLIDSSNESGYLNPDVDRLLEEARSIHDPKKRKDLYTKVLEILQRDVPEIVLLLEYINSAYRKYVKDFKADPITMAHFAGGGLAFVWLDK